eukprot:m.14267 g.14267  ORF g.14267 m.14267 type:complete len:413 (-) comp6369_c0_seq1:34-1272(-)
MALRAACRSGQAAKCRDLIREGAKVDEMDEDGYVPLYHAVMTGSAACVKHLLEAGANPNFADHTLGVPVLHTASMLNHDAIVALLIEHGADVNSLDNEHSTALHWAAGAGATQCAETLMRHNANLSIRNDDGHTPVDLAQNKGDTALGLALMRLQEEQRENELLVVASSGRDVAKQLAGAAREERAAENLDLLTSLRTAAREGRQTEVEELLAQGASASQAEALHAAAAYNHEAIVTLLLDHGALVNAMDGRGLTALAWAARMDAAAAARVLLAHGAAVDSVTSSGQSAADLAEARGSTAVAAVLQTHQARPASSTVTRTSSPPAPSSSSAPAREAPAPRAVSPTEGPTLEGTNLGIFLAALNIYDDYDELFETEGIDSPADLGLYSVEELVEAGMKRAHAKKIIATVLKNN